jgi:hypothetical protein
LALHRETLGILFDSVSNRRKLPKELESKADNQKYIEKIMREEVIKQFSTGDRPMLEIMLNGVDARPEDFEGQYSIDVRLKRRKFSCADNGYGMTLDDILRLLIIPFNTEKDGITQIGRFGVGFLSSLNYCLESEENSVYIDTYSAEEAHRILFYAKKPEVQGLRMRVKPLRKKKKTGTTVTIYRSIPGRYNTIKYLKNHVENIPDFHTAITINSKTANAHPDSKWYHGDVELKIRDKKIKQKAGFMVDDSGQTKLTAQGVLVKSHPNDGCGRAGMRAGMTVFFPAAIQVVEGRDEFKQDDNYRKCVDAVFSLFPQYLKDEEKTPEFIRYMTEFIPSILSHFDYSRVTDIKNIDEIRDILFPGKKYVITWDKWQKYEPFLGNTVGKYAFWAYMQALKCWKRLYRGADSMFKDALNVLEEMTPIEFAKKVQADDSPYPNLHLLSYLAAEGRGAMKGMKYLADSREPTKVKLVETELGETPIFWEQTGHGTTLYGPATLYVNVKHPYVVGELNPTKVYAIASDYMRFAPVKELFNFTKDESEEIVRDLTGKLLRSPSIAEKEEQRKKNNKPSWLKRA